MAEVWVDYALTLVKEFIVKRLTSYPVEMRIEFYERLISWLEDRLDSDTAIRDRRNRK